MAGITRFARSAAAILAVCCMLAGPISAAPRHWYKNKWWWIGECVIAAGITADMGTTAQNQAHGAVELNGVFLPRYPAPSQLATFGAAAFVWYTGLHMASARLEENNSLPRRVASLVAMPATVVSINGVDAMHNARLRLAPDRAVK